MKISVIYSPAPRQISEWTLDVSSGTSVQQALEKCPELEESLLLTKGTMILGIWGKRVALNQLLQENDRVEIYRGLQIDPKVARRERFKRQGIKSAGLFSTKRAGAKSGY